MPGVYIVKKTSEYSKKQSKVINLILKSPGIRYRQLLRYTGLANGSLSHVLSKLENSRRITVNRCSNNRVTSYYPKSITTTELQIIASLRDNTKRRIVQFLLERGQCTFNNIVKETEKAPSTISRHLKKLKDAKLIKANNKHDKPRPYKLRNKNVVARILSKYKGAFV